MARSTTLVWAHRGASSEARENTLDAFRMARERHADGVELDVRRTLDGALIVHHDAQISGLGPVSERTWDEVQQALPYIPTLAEALDVLDGMRVNVEIKNLPGEPDFDPTDAVANAVLALLAERDGRDDVLVSSFNLDTINRVRAVNDAPPTAWLTLFGLDPLDAVGLAADLGHVALHPQSSALAGDNAAATAQRAHERGLRVNVWTVDDPDEIRRLADAGVDGVITNDPAAARAALGRD